MNKVLGHIFILLLFNLFLSNLCFAEVSNIGEYSIQFNLGNRSPSSNVVVSDVALSIDLPKGDEIVHIPLPFQKTPDLESIIEPNSSNNLVLLGFVRPNEQYAVIQISLLESPTNIYVLVKNVTLPLQESSRSESGRAVCILMSEAYNRVETLLGKFHAPRLKEIFVRTANFQDSEPKAEMAGVYPERKIRIDESLKIPPDIFVFLGRTQNQYLLYIVLGIMGILLGYFAAPKIMPVSSRAKWSLLTSVIGMGIIVGIFFILLTPEQRFTDTTTIVTIGTVFGLLAGLFIASLASFSVAKN